MIASFDRHRDEYSMTLHENMPHFHLVSRHLIKSLTQIEWFSEMHKVDDAYDVRA